MASNVTMMRGGPTPEVALNYATQSIEHFDAVLVMGIMKDGTVGTTWSQMKISDLCLLSKSLDTEISTLLEESRGRASAE